jgi:hypothetical protein
MRTTSYLWIVAWLLVIFLLAGCVGVPVPAVSTGTDPTLAVELTTNPFTSRAEGADGIINEWSGNAGEHRPGEVSTFDLLLDNQSEDLWEGRYCIFLLSPEWLLQEMVRGDFVLEQGAASEQIVELAFPDDLAPGGYGLALIVQRPAGPTIQLTSIEVGKAAGERAPLYAQVPEPLVEIARAKCIPTAEAYTRGIPPVGMEAEDTVRLFYWDYLEMTRPDDEGYFVNPLVERAYRDSPHLAEGFVRQIDAMLEDEIRFDPFLCAQDVPRSFVIGGARITEDAVFVRVRSGLGNEFDVVVADQGDVWRIINVICSP